MVTLTGARLSSRTAVRPANPPPITTTLGGGAPGALDPALISVTSPSFPGATGQSGSHLRPVALHFRRRMRCTCATGGTCGRARAGKAASATSHVAETPTRFAAGPPRVED